MFGKNISTVMVLIGKRGFNTSFYFTKISPMKHFYISKNDFNSMSGIISRKEISKGFNVKIIKIFLDL